MTTKKDDQKQAQEQSTVRANQAPDAQQPGVTQANQDWEAFRAETPEAQTPANPTHSEPSVIKGDAPHS